MDFIPDKVLTICPMCEKERMDLVGFPRNSSIASRSRALNVFKVLTSETIISYQENFKAKGNRKGKKE